MNEPFSRARRIVVAGISLALSAWLLRSPVAQALVSRGDDYLYAGNRYQALVHYRRSFALDPDSEIAADRIVFVAALQRSRAEIASGIAAATRYLQRHPRSAELLADRGLCYLKLRAFDAAYLDFYGAAALQRKPQAYTFAGWAALRSGHPALAKHMWQNALHVSHDYRPALSALERYR
ncbi:MAG TPA: hypothetical protein VFL13_03520 [Candidatus Baltobacteraceae bacterium]|nr:hypothetical protein [Candidatus Baltobacteraceae bacterium]